ncbi:TPA: hypothetical protein HA235_03360 [Candidatus Woesearchaeota archaeon]|nr:hypothetical protein [Candidatus Woesearchaeota archaeon]HIH31720.1 hypothetical protein [Candidatus Woesearchaeota archaeon]HIH55024.1 hypothetical protein [Candidatus Woesearchaeota archaeon]HIJ01032.1 hypothetical protein [Candidatus Woesearchaeota archaeon]HIJ14748.1 hypothetical protein [Candidatus Woesearchaeota archaeon]
MPHVIREQHIGELCASCKKPHGNHIEIMHNHHKVYEIIQCQFCDYKMIRRKEEQEFNNRFMYM